MVVCEGGDLDGGLDRAVSFAQAVEFVLQCEGGLVDDPADPGGLTNRGISQRAYPNEDIRNLTVERAKELYSRDYWTAARCDELPPGMALVVFDSAVNCGVSRALNWLSQYPDMDDYLWNRLAYYRGLAQKTSTLGKFFLGWVRRLELLRQAVPQQT